MGLIFLSHGGFVSKYLTSRTNYLLALIVVLTVIPAIAQDDLVSYESGICQFRLSNFELSTQAESAIIFGTTKILDTYKKTFGFRYPSDFKVKIVIFGEKADFHAYQKEKIGSVISETGYFSGRDRETVVWQNKDIKKMIGVIFHEVNHLILTYHIPRCPDWINEGLSEYFEGLNVIGSDKRVYLQQARHQWCRIWLKHGFPIELDDYLSLSHDEWKEFRKADPNASYTIGYSLVYYMMSSVRTEKILKEMLWDLRRNYGLADSVKVVQSNYSGGMKAFERHWKKWIPRARKYRPLRALRSGERLPKIPERNDSADKDIK